jgi:pimeloyl-ACP methyl ester carboxylesterase
LALIVNGVELDYLESGAGVPVVFCHGGGSDLRYWEPQRAAFAATYRFVSYSRRFFGAAPAPVDGDDSAEAHTADLVAIIRYLHAGPVHLVGFSSPIAVRAAMAAPELIRSLTVIEPNAPSLLDADAEGQGLLAAWREANERLRVEADGDPKRRAERWFELVNNRGPGTFEAQPGAFRRMWLDNFGRARPAASPAGPLTCDDLAGIAAPTLALGSEHGMPYSRRILDRVAGCIPGGSLVILPDSTHFMSYQAADRFNAVVLEFLDRH